MDVDTSSNGASSAHSTSTAVYSASPDRFLDGRASSVSLDDPDVRMAAEALGDLKADFVSSPIHRATPPRSPRSLTTGPQPEPLLSLLTTSHPFIERTIDSATSAYTSSKNYYPRIKTSIEYVEGYVVPIANTVGSVGRVTGVETGVRWFLRRTKPHGSDLEEQGSSKRRKVGAGDDSHSDASPAPGSGTRTPRASLEIPDERRLSMASTIDVPPEYDEFRAPPYTKQPPGSGGDPSRPTWHSRLIVSTSGLSIAMSEESLRSLKYCLSWIRWANAHIGHVVNSLTITMQKYEQGGQESGGHDSATVQDQEDRSQLAAKIGVLNSDVLRTLQDVINTVSRYAGGALPENARELVRQHLTSLPQRFHLANQAQDRAADQRAASSMEEGRREQERREETQTRESARRAILLAKEGLDMMWQVSQVLNGTIVSAEEWCERLSSKKKEQREDLTGISHSPSEDTKMG
ncbi:transcription factor Opi1-domain-containing protein [Xylaria grammica]|nr:transcription factor Opi1-domain-containing protein [Xylaria grammica]